MWTADLSVDIRRSATSRTAIGGGISSQHPWGDNSCESILTMSLIPKGSLLEQSEEDNSLSTSEVTNLWHYTNLFIIIIIFLNLGRSSRGGRQKLTLEIIALMVNHPSGSHQGLRSRMLTRSSCLSFRLQPAGRCASYIIINICQHKHRTDCNTTDYNMVKYVEQDRKAQKCSYLGPKQTRN